jgi:hypothetical protein
VRRLLISQPKDAKWQSPAVIAHLMAARTSGRISMRMILPQTTLTGQALRLMAFFQHLQALVMIANSEMER